MESNNIEEQLKLLEAEQFKANEIYIEIANKIVIYDEDLKKCYNEIMLMRMEFIIAKLEFVKLKQELKDNDFELNTVDEELEKQTESMEETRNNLKEQ